MTTLLLSRVVLGPLERSTFAPATGDTVVDLSGEAPRLANGEELSASALLALIFSHDRVVVW